MSELLTRRMTLDSVTIGGVDTGPDAGRLLDVRLVPYDTEARIGTDEWEVFRPGAFRAQLRAASRVRLTDGHSSDGRTVGATVGVVRALDDRPDGLHGTVKVSRTARGDELLELITDGALDEVSIGFVPVRSRPVPRPAGGRLVERLAARLDHLALVDRGAYGPGARVLAMRDDDTPRVRLADLQARIARIG